MWRHTQKTMETKNNNNGNKNGTTQTVEAPKVSIASPAPTNPINAQETPAPTALVVLQPQKTTTLKEVFERNDAITRKREAYNDFCKKLDEFIYFRETHDGGALKTTIENEEGKRVVIANLQMNLDYLDMVILKGKEAKEQLELDILNSGGWRSTI